MRPTGTCVAGTAVSALLLAGAARAQSAAERPGWVVFDVPGLDIPAGSPIDMSFLNRSPAGANGFISCRDGHFVDGKGRRLRFFGVNITGDSCFPDASDAVRLARRLRRWGVNCVRLHFMDFNRKGSIWKDADRNELDPAQLERLDRLIAEFANNGIYVNINLHVGRWYPGQPRDPATRLFRFGKTLDRWYPPYVAMLEDYARKLLTHVNRFRGKRLADDPAVAVIEINNENTMIRDLRPQYRNLPEPFKSAFTQRWTAWLRKKYGTLEGLKQVWNADVQPLGPDLLAEGRWTTQYAGGAAGKFQRENGVLVWEVKQKGTQSWHVQLQYKRLPLRPGERYTLIIEARSRPNLSLHCSVMLDAPPWSGVAFRRTLPLGAEWRTFRLVDTLSTPPAPGPLRLNLSTGNRVGRIEFRRIALHPGGGSGLPEGQDFDQGIGIPADDATEPVLNDFVAFLIDTEVATTRRIMEFLKNEVGCRMPVIDTQASYGGPAGVYREATCSDYIDMHGYWQHPAYTRNERGWVVGFRIPNSSQVEAGTGGSLGMMAMHRVAGKPFSVSEYNTPSPNDHGAELFPLLVSVAALQDWDAVYGYTYRDFGKDYANTTIKRWFHLIGRANVLVHVPAAALAFRCDLIRPAPAGTQAVRLELPFPRIAGLTRKFERMPDLWRALGADPALPWMRRCEVAPAQSDVAPRVLGPKSVPAGIRRSVTGQVRWAPDDPAGPWFVLEAPCVKFLVGHVAGREFDLGDGVRVRVHPRSWPRSIPAYACVSLVALDEQPIPVSRRLLLAASARTENQEMRWNEDRTGLVDMGKAWGHGPPVSETVPADVALPGRPVNVVTLDARGRPGEPLAVDAGNRFVFSGPGHETLWCLITR